MELKDVFEQRQSVNFFDSAKDVDEAIIREIYDLAKLAPSSFNLQPWKIVLVHNPEQKAKLQKCAMDQPKVSESAFTAIMLGDKKAYENMDPIMDGFIKLGYFKEEMRVALKGMAKNLYGGDSERTFACRNVGLFAMAFMLAAESLGIDTHPMDGFDAKAIRAEFNIPDNYEIVMLIAIGHFDQSKTLLPRCPRRSFDEVVIRESF
ncbi:MAG: nitroreductase family protein [bacterium]